MHSHALNGSGGRTVQASDPVLAAEVDETGKHPADPDKEDDHAKGQGLRLRIEEDQRGRNVPAERLGDSGDDTGSDGRNPSDLSGPADSDRRAGVDGAVREPERASGLQRGHGEVPKELARLDAFRIPAKNLVRALELGVDVGLADIIEQTGDETPEQVLKELAASRMQLWAIAKDGKPAATMITQLEQRPATKTLVVRYLAGRKMGEWAEAATNALKAFAQEQQCNGIEAIGRDGLRRYLDSLGWSKVAVVYHLPTEPESPADG